MFTSAMQYVAGLVIQFSKLAVVANGRRQGQSLCCNKYLSWYYRKRKLSQN